jgi:hypothetical protein
MRGRVTRLEGGKPHVEVPDLGVGHSFGPIESLVAGLEVDDRVLVGSQVGGVLEDVVVLGLLEGTAGGGGGADGEDGREIELGVSATHIRWRYVGDPGWTNLVALADLEGADGLSPEMRVSGGFIQWRQAGGVWANLVELTDLTGADGAPGQTVGLRYNWRDPGSATWPVPAADATLMDDYSAFACSITDLDAVDRTDFLNALAVNAFGKAVVLVYRASDSELLLTRVISDTAVEDDQFVGYVVGSLTDPAIPDGTDVIVHITPATRSVYELAVANGWTGTEGDLFDAIIGASVGLWENNVVRTITPPAAVETTLSSALPTSKPVAAQITHTVIAADLCSEPNGDLGFNNLLFFQGSCQHSGVAAGTNYTLSIELKVNGLTYTVADAGHANTDRGSWGCSIPNAQVGDVIEIRIWFSASGSVLDWYSRRCWPTRVGKATPPGGGRYVIRDVNVSSTLGVWTPSAALSAPSAYSASNSTTNICYHQTVLSGGSIPSYVSTTADPVYGLWLDASFDWNTAGAPNVNISDAALTFVWGCSGMPLVITYDRLAVPTPP